MFEGLLESVLGSFLKKYLEGFSSDNLKLSVWSGKISLENLTLRSDIFKQFKLPLELVFGKLGKLKITVPWSSLGSNPVDVLIEDILIVVSKSYISHTL
jgi:vacuolar protein sorting-associated protein 13A/C